MDRCNYQTKQKKILLDLIQKKEKEFCIKELHQEVENVGLTTIYRFIEQLENEGLLKRMMKNGDTYYQYLEKCSSNNHFYLKCNSCHKMIHVDCSCIDKISNHILEEHGFHMDRNQLIISGICNNCIGR